ncbi:MAG: ABC transporter substrate-binding protein [Dehalococcoidia bacterium]|nr:ABC transporter substrate-binding protein [Dehalococcoidia bacterium]
MRKSVISLFSLLILASFIAAACKPAATPTPPPAPVVRPTATRVVTPTPKPEWQVKWGNALAEAKKEGKVSIYALWGQDTRVAVSQAFRDKFGIEAEFTSFARGAELLAKVKLEQNAGLNIPDVFGAGGPTFITTMKPAGVLGQIQPLLFLPEVTDTKMWNGGKLAFSDKEGNSIAMGATAQRFMVYNTNLVKKGEITSYEDALKPQFKDKISINDPTVTGSGNAVFSHLALNVWDVEKTKDFYTRLLRDQGAEVIRDNRLQIEVVAKGKHSLGIGGRIATQAEFLDAGAPIAQVATNDVFVSHGDGVLGVPPKSPHPNATLVFVNWILSKEGHAVWVKSTGNPGLRVDAPKEGINPIFFINPEEKLFLDSEEAILFRGKMISVAKEVIAAVGKAK